MTTRAVPGELVATSTPQELSREACSRVAKALAKIIAIKGGASLALSGGTTPRETYERLGSEPGIDWSKVDVFWIDERAVPPDSDRSNYYWAKVTLLDRAKVPADRVHRMPGEAPDLDAAAREYERVLRARVEADAQGIPSLDVAVMGIGDDGHTASLFPGLPTLDIADRLVAAVPAHAGLEPRLTLTVPAIEHIKNVYYLVNGADKHPALERVWALQGDIHETPARVVRGCRGVVTWIVNQAAADVPARP
jgi:6-phosphogluconolactonase